MKAEPRREQILKLLEKTGIECRRVGRPFCTQRSYDPERWPFLSGTGPTKHSSAVRALLPKGDTARKIANMHRSKKPSYGLPNRRMSS
jgi:hypothetical protein